MREIIFICLLLLYGLSSVVLADSIKPSHKDSSICLYVKQVYKRSNPDKVKLLPVYVKSKAYQYSLDTLRYTKNKVGPASSVHPSLYAHLQGVYLIINDLTVSFFICSAINIPAHVQMQNKALNANACPNQRLQKAWNRYGELSFSYRLLEQVAGSESYLGQREAYWKEHFKSIQINHFSPKLL